MTNEKVLLIVLMVFVILAGSAFVCEEGGLLDTQPCPPIFKTERAATLTR